MKMLYFLFGVILFTSTISAQLTYVPDDNFEQALIDLGYDNVLDNYVLTANIESVEGLEIRYLNISDLTGIEDFKALEFLDFAGNQVTILDLSENVALTWLNCGGNQCTSIDVSQNTLLEILICVGNLLTSLDVSNNTNLDFLNIWDNQLASLDVSQNISLTYLDFFDNQISSIDVSNNTILDVFYCDNNQLTSLNLTANIFLTELWCNDNQLTELNVKNGNNSILGILKAYNNPDLTCIEVDNAVSAYGNLNWMKDSTAIYSEDCSTVGIEENLEMAFNGCFYPNPLSTTATIDYELEQPAQVSLSIYNHLGQQIETLVNQHQLQGKHQTTWNAEGLPSGIYFYRLQAGEQQATGKMVVLR